MKAILPKPSCFQTTALLALLTLLLWLAAPVFGQAAESERISLNGDWAFAADYLDMGDHYEWFSPAYNDAVWDKVTTPHVWSMDPRFPYFIGAGWYRKHFSVPPELKDRHVRLVFEAVSAHSKVWLNGQLIAEHRGGYTPFEVDVSQFLDFTKPNLFVVRADNRRSKMATGPEPQNQVSGWMEDGGIIRDVYLVATPPVFITKQKVEAVPDLQNGDASVRLVTWVRNVQKEPATCELSAEFWRGQEALQLPASKARLTVAAGATASVEMKIHFPRESVHLWNLDTPELYQVRTALAGKGASHTETFGFRKFEVRGTELFFNGHPVRLAGANRVASSTEFGQNDPPEAVERDMRLMKEAGLEFMRMHHVPLSRAVLDWADRYGMLLIEECSHATAFPLDNEEQRAEYRSQQREMLERDWNRPCIVAWSVGNELASETPAGVSWVRDMADFTRSLDATRPICFASNRAAKPTIKPEEEGSSWMDFVCLNTYGATPAENAANIDRVHQRWPNKPFIITEFGLRADRVADETEREAWFGEMIRIFRERPFLSGISLWSFNDYRSRYVGTNPDGYRWWGLVDGSRNLRGSYRLFQREFGPVSLKDARMDQKSATVKLAGPADFPVYPPSDCQVRLEFFDGRNRSVGVQTQVVKGLKPGGEIELHFPANGGRFFKGQILRGTFLMRSFGTTSWPEQKAQ